MSPFFKTVPSVSLDLLSGVNTGLLLLTAQVVFFGFRWNQLRQTLN